MIPIPVRLHENAGLARLWEPILIGVPIPFGELRDPGELVVLQSCGEPLAASVTPCSRWSDGSVRWAHVAFHLPELEPHGVVELELVGGDQGQRTGEAIEVRREGARTEISTVAGRFLLDGTGTLRHLRGAHVAEVRPVFLGAGGEPGEFIGDPPAVERRGPLVVAAQNGWLRDRMDGGTLAARIEYTFDPHGTTTRVDCTVHNPAAAHHPGGLWDLGDPASRRFTAVGLEVRPAEKSAEVQITDVSGDAHHRLALADPVVLHQESSGGEHWDSVNHCDADGNVPLRYRGYRLLAGSNRVASGWRIDPIVQIGAGGRELAVWMRDFWQSFPSAIEASEDGLVAWLFPRCGAAHELQGGERKRRTLYIDWSGNEHALRCRARPVQAVLDPQHYSRARVLPFFAPATCSAPLEELIGACGPEGFLAKREVIDEYGWRHFGDVFADHESHYRAPGEPPFVSHYNNQYDALEGFLRRFLRTADPRWWQLMDDLAHHVVDIDIYHTDGDRPDYNHGLFWHTDHYLDAWTATHRTFSRHNPTSSTEGQTGGGPGDEHCYATGLAHHFFVTGDVASRAAVLELAGWMRELFEGEGLLRTAASWRRRELAQLRALLRGDRVVPYRWPFTRATGNYLNVLLDEYELTGEPATLAHAARVIRETMNPRDDIDARDLLDVEPCWSYTVMLCAVARFVEVCSADHALPVEAGFARDALVHYARWMAGNERPYLSRPDILEFPNDTWAAQELRKAFVLLAAANMSAEDEPELRERGRYFLEVAAERLRSSPELTYTRIQVILLQHDGLHGLVENERDYSWLPSVDWPDPPVASIPAVLWSMTRGLARALLRLSPSRELHWLRARMR